LEGRFLLTAAKMLKAYLEETTNLSIVGLYLNIGNALNPLNPAIGCKQQHHMGGKS
jgi:hypothetical protein